MSLNSLFWRSVAALAMTVLVGVTHAAPTMEGGNGEPARFIARKEPVEQLFKALGSEMHKAFRLSAKARSYRVSGDFDLSKPFDALEMVTANLGLIWYYDGQVVYIYDGGESTSVMLPTPPGTAENLIAFLKGASLYDGRFPISHTSGTGLIYLSGPPKYVEIVRNIASLLHTHERGSQHDDCRVEIVKLRHAFVADRIVDRRDMQETIPGLARSLAEVMRSGAAVRAPAAGDDVDLAPLAAPGELPIPLPPSAAREVPPLDMVDAGPLDEPHEVASRQIGRTAVIAGPLIDGIAPMRIVAYPANNSLLLEGTTTQIATARRVIAQLDVPKDQVELSLWVIDLHKQDAETLGAQWHADGKVGRVAVDFNSSVLSQGATLSHAQALRFIASVTALSERNKARIVSHPILLAQDNNPAVFDNSKSFYVKIRGERTATLHKVTYGTMINVVPHVADTKGRIEMELAIEDGTSSAPGTDSGLDLPVVSSTRISTIARVQHEQSLLVGGYTLDEDTDLNRKIPLLGDIPAIGRLFTYRSHAGSNSVRLFLIQPRLLGENSKFDADRVAPSKEIDNAVDVLRAQVNRSRGR